MRVGGTVWNSFKKGGTENRGGETNILKREEQTESGVGVLKGVGGDGTPLQTAIIVWRECM